MPLSQLVEEYFDRLVPVGGKRDSADFIARWQGAFKLRPETLKDERVAAIVAKLAR